MSRTDTILELGNRGRPLLERLRLLKASSPARAIMHEAADRIEELEIALRAASGPTQEEVDALADAMCMVLNDMGDDGLSVCALVKAKARLAFVPFELEDSGDLMELDKAHAVIASAETTVSG